MYLNPMCWPEIAILGLNRRVCHNIVDRVVKRIRRFNFQRHYLRVSH